MAEEDQINKEVILVKYVRGFPVPNHILFPSETVECAMDYVPKNNDVILCGYPRTGTTWSIYILWQVLHSASGKCIVADIPNVEVSGPDVIDSMPEPRLYKYHLPYDRIKINKNAKYIYVYRKPEDTVASYFHFMKELSYNDISFDFYFDAFMKGKAAFGDYFDHVLASYDHRNDDNLLMLSYEVLKKDTRKEILRIAEFLGQNYYRELTKNNADILSKILEISNFDYMKKNVASPIPSTDEGGKQVNFYRHGKAGDGKRHLSPEQANILKSRIQEKMRGTEIMDAWLS